MKLFIMRHGEAESLQVNDEDRRLTPKGEQQVRESGLWLKEIVGEIDFAIVSPYRRTLQTFFTLKEVLAIKQDVLSSDVIPSGNPELVHDYVDCVLGEQPDIENVLIVSHMPIVSYLVDTFTGSERSIIFPTAGVVQINYIPDISRGEYVGMSPLRP